MPEADSKVSRGFRSADSEVTLIAMGMVNPFDDLTRFRKDLLAQPQNSGITYKPKGDGWFVLSGYRGNSIYYEKYVFSEDEMLVQAFVIEYDKAQKSVYNTVSARISKAFKYSETEWVAEDIPEPELTLEQEEALIVADERQVIIDAVSQTQPLEWRRYENTAAGWQIDYPANLLYPKPQVSRPTVRQFSNTDGDALLILSGSKNALGEIPAYIDFVFSQGRHENVIEQTGDGNWYVVSGKRDNKSRLFAEKYVFSPDFLTVQVLSFEYPADADPRYFDAAEHFLRDFEFHAPSTPNAEQTANAALSETDLINAVSVDGGVWDKDASDDVYDVMTFTITNNTNAVLHSLQLDPFRSGQWHTIDMKPPLYPGGSGIGAISVLRAADGMPAETFHRPKDRQTWWPNMHRNLKTQPFVRTETFTTEVNSWLFGN